MGWRFVYVLDEFSGSVSSTGNHFMPFSSMPIRVLLVDNSPMALALQQKMLASAPNIEVVATAANGQEALRLLPEMKPHVVCTDFQMPVMSGLELVQNIMVTAPCPVLIVSSLVQTSEHDKLLPLLAAGAIDVFLKPTPMQDFESTARAFTEKIRVLAGVFVFARRVAAAPNATPTVSPTASVDPVSTPQRNSVPPTKSPPFEYSKAISTPPTSTPPTSTSLVNDWASSAKTADAIKIVGIGSSTGGPQVLQQIFSQLPANFPHPILCVQHISAGFLAGLVDWLDASSRVRVKVMKEGEIARGGTVYFPVEGCHMTIDADGRLRSSSAALQDGHRPSATTLFNSLAQSYGETVLAILLTGMGEDGARGLYQVFEAGGQTIAQNETSCVVFGMPRKAIELGAAQQILSPDEIVKVLQRHSESRRLATMPHRSA